jgi:hypothetical protein
MDAQDNEPEGKTAALVPVREQTVDFYGDPIPGALVEEGEWYVPLRPLTDFLGLAFGPQRRRVLRDDVLAARLRRVVITAADGKRYSTLCLPLDMLPGWLFGITPNKTRPELAEKIKRYRAECFRVLWQAFRSDVLAPAPAPADLNPAEQALLLAEAVASLARQHLDLEQRHTTMADYLRPFVQETRHRLAAHEERIGALEVRLSSGATISEDQAAEIALAVKNVAMVLTQQGDANGFGRVWGDLYRRFRVGAYRNLPAARFDEVLAWLHGWYNDLQGGTDPA